MNKFNLKSQILPSLIATSLLSVVVLPVKPAVANDLLRDIGIGAAANVVTGEIIDNGSTLGNAVKGAATGAAVNATHDSTNNSVGGTIQDAAIGAAGGTILGEIFGDANVEEIVGGAAAGVLVGNITADRVVVIDPNKPIILYDN